MYLLNSKINSITVSVIVEDNKGSRACYDDTYYVDFDKGSNFSDLLLNSFFEIQKEKLKNNEYMYFCLRAIDATDKIVFDDTFNMDFTDFEKIITTLISNDIIELI